LEDIVMTDITDIRDVFLDIERTRTCIIG